MTTLRSQLLKVSLLGAIGLAVAMSFSAWAGDPVPDVDVILEQVPGGVIEIRVGKPLSLEGTPVSDVDIIIEKLSGLRFDGMRLSGDKALSGLTIKNLPPGWGLQRDGKRLMLRGPAVTPPVRFVLDATQSRPSRFDVDLMSGAKVLFAYKKLVPREVKPRVVAGTVKGTVRLPAKVSPGETIALRALAGSDLPRDGVWEISGKVSGTVSEPWDEDELRSLFTIVNTTRSNIKRGAASRDDRPIELAGDGGCDGLAPVAAVLLGRVGPRIAETLIVVAKVAAPTPGGGGESRPLLLHDLSTGATAHRAAHDVAMGSIRNIRYAYATAEEPAGGIAIKEKGLQVTAVDRSHAGTTESWQLGDRSAGQLATWQWTSAAALVELGPERVEVAAFDGEPIAGGCRYSPRDPNSLEVLRWARMQVQNHGGRPSGKPGVDTTGKPPKESVHVVVLPDDLLPGDPISVRYVDAWGDPWVEVERADVEVVPQTDEERQPSIDSASPYAVSGDQICVCGVFQPEAILAPFSVGSATVEAVSVSRNIAWLQTPTTEVGPSLIRGEGFRGEASTDVLRVRAELDQENLFSGQSTPLRILIEGSSRNLPIRITNRSPGVIEIEGGNDQRTESSGGSVNQVTRQVRGVERGTFDLSWELSSATCPCAPPLTRVPDASA